MAGRNVEFASNGGRASGYLSPPTGGAGPGVLVIQEWWGLNSHIRRSGRPLRRRGLRRAGAGPLPRPPDARAGRGRQDVDGARRRPGGPRPARRGQLPARRGRGDREPPRRGRLLHGRPAGALAGTVAPEQIGAVVDFYGIHPNVEPDWTKLQAPVLGLFAENDGSIPLETVRELERQVRAAGRQIETHVYPGVDHAFMNDERPEVYSADAATDGWRRTLSFFRAHLR